METVFLVCLSLTCCPRLSDVQANINTELHKMAKTFLRHSKQETQPTIKYKISQRPTLERQPSDTWRVFFANTESLFLGLLQSAVVVCFETRQRRLKDGV